MKKYIRMKNIKKKLLILNGLNDDENSLIFLDLIKYNLIIIFYDYLKLNEIFP